jgi:hypothetical protein
MWFLSEYTDLHNNYFLCENIHYYFMWNLQTMPLSKTFNITWNYQLLYAESTILLYVEPDFLWTVITKHLSGEWQMTERFGQYSQSANSVMNIAESQLTVKIIILKLVVVSIWCLSRQWVWGKSSSFIYLK